MNIYIYIYIYIIYIKTELQIGNGLISFVLPDYPFN